MDKTKKYITNNFKESKKLGESFAAEILVVGPQKTATILALSGDLGAGKTTFLQGFAKGLGIEEIVNSPTFVILKRFMMYDLGFKNFYHIDCYRLNSPDEMLQLGFAEIISNPKNIVAIEWPEKLGSVLPKNVIQIKFNHLEENKREVNVIE